MVSPDSPRPPLLRSRRFWIGLSGFLLTLGFYISTGHLFIGLSHSKRISKISEHGFPMKLERMIVITEGSIGYSRTESEISHFSRSFPHWKFDCSENPAMYRWKRGHEWLVTSGIYGRLMHFPLWPLPLLWLIGWLVYMIRASRREARHSSGQP